MVQTQDKWDFRWTVDLSNGFGVANSVAGTRNGNDNDLHNIHIFY